jgi:hypothetical protein
VRLIHHIWGLTVTASGEAFMAFFRPAGICHVASLVLVAWACASPADIQLPQPPVVPTPAPEPGAVLTLGADQLYVAQSDAEFVVRDHPKGVVKVTLEKGPIRIRGKFAGGTGVETRSFDQPYVAFAEAVGKGRVELDFLPIGLKAEKDIRSAVLDVDGNTVPVPKPPDPPKPLPDGKLGLVKASRDGLARVAGTNRDANAKSLAVAQRALAASVVSNRPTDPAKILSAWRDGNHAAVASPDAWKGWGEVVSAALAKLYADGKLPDAAAWSAAFVEVAEGLEGVNK